ncbi:hypothetical protein [Vallitalea guaymasensis]|uniref:Uncharacterized protein n=1 Tax=Vallitalea guaymasensis TaxID=1185412 RepID=A0A8J8M725_9FIRM|nr:hypothetical protein [Vallitalea guaymasensis]QUH27531.1 hypothetical protein HYG85_00790 [Vallitalea guaymasensis]
MKVLKYFICIFSIFICIFLSGCTSKKIDFIAGEFLYEINDDNVEVTFIKKNDKNYDKQKYKNFVENKLKKHKEIDVKIKNIELYGDNIRITFGFDDLDDLDRVLETNIFHDSLQDYLDDNNIDYDQFEDKDILYNVLSGEEITEEQLEDNKKYSLIRLDCNNSKIKVNGDIIYASKQGEIIKKDTIYFKDYGTYYVLYKPSTGISKWVLWALLLLIVSYAVYLSIKWQSSKKSSVDCYYCGQKNDYDAIYCKICGNKIISDIKDDKK